MNRYFNISRFYTLLKREAHVNIKRDLLIIGAMYSIFTIIIFLVFEFNNDVYKKEFFEQFHFVTYTIMLFVGGVFITSFSFMELRNRMKSHFYLLTPGSNFEKFATNMFISFIGYLLFMIVSYLIYASLFNWICYELYDFKFTNLSIIANDFILVTQIYILVHSVFFLGSVSFKKYPLIITPIAIFVLITILSLFNLITEKIILTDMEISNIVENNIEAHLSKYKTTIKLCAFYILPVILWFTAYLKLKEKEY